MSGKRILIIGPNWLGDLVFLTPAIRAIRRAFPDGFIAVQVPIRGADLLKGHPHLDEVIPFEESRGLRGFLKWCAWAGSLRKRRFDAVFLFHRSFTRAAAAWLAGIPTRIGYRTWKRSGLLTQGVDAPPPDSVHKAVWFLKMLEGAGIPSDGFRYEVGLLAEDRQMAGDLLKNWGARSEDRLVALHPGANWRLKRWPAGNFARLADALAARYRARVIFIGEGGDLPLVERIAREMQTRPWIATGKTTFRQLGALLAQTRLLISNDSGPLHLGMAVGTPVIALFGPTDPKLTGPLNGVEGATLFGSIGCPVPCYQLRCPVNLCMHQITVDQVLRAAATYLQ